MAYLLMIDDNPQSRRYIERIIRHRSRHEIGFAETAEGAIESLVERRPDVIFLDLFIPGMDGIEFFEMIRQHPATEKIPVIIHSAIALDQVTRLRLKQLRKRLRYEGFLRFPVEASELNRLIDTALKKTQTITRKWEPPAV